MKRLLTYVLAAAALCAAHTPASADDEVDRVLSRFDHEPTIREVQVAAIKYYNVSPEKISSLRTRTRTKALVPGITVGFSNSLSSFNKSVDDIVFRTAGIAVFENQTADFLGFSASASWAFDRLVFNAEELDVMSLIGIQDGIQREVTALYYVRRRLQIELLLNPPKTLEARLSGRLRLEELTGLLDAYTGGFFSREIEKNQRRRELEKNKRRQPQSGAADMPAEATGVASLDMRDSSF